MKNYEIFSILNFGFLKMWKILKYRKIKYRGNTLKLNLKPSKRPIKDVNYTKIYLSRLFAPHLKKKCKKINDKKK